MADLLNAQEAVFGFAAWLTSRKEETIMGARSDCAGIADLVKTFCDENNLPPISNDWANNLIHPNGEAAVPGMGKT